MAKAGYTQKSQTIQAPTLKSTITIDDNPTAGVGSGIGGASTIPQSLWLTDMSTAYHFKINIPTLFGYDDTKLLYHKSYDNFLPIETASFSPVAVDPMSLSIGIFADLPLATKRRLGRLKMTLNDTDDHRFKKAFMEWFASCVPTSSGFVRCMDEIIKGVSYVEYSNTGEKTGHYTFFVMPEGELNVNRNYNANELTKFDVSLIIVSEITDVLKNGESSYVGD